jgi:hypothetical protein
VGNCRERTELVWAVRDTARKGEETFLPVLFRMLLGSGRSGK